MGKFILPLSKLNRRSIMVAGGKGANLGELIKIGIQIPVGFVVLTKAFEKFLEKTNIEREINWKWKKIKTESIKFLEEKAEIIRALILEAKIPVEIEKEIFDAFKKLKTKYVAVRSSATAEDTQTASWAGELDSYLNTTKETLIENIKKCWASLFNPRALFYRTRNNLWNQKILMGVIIQKMIQSDVSGVCFTICPITKNKNQMVIEAIWGLGEMLVQGEVTPDIYAIDKSDFKILNITIAKQKRMIVKNKIGNKILLVPKSRQKKQKLSEKQIKTLARICLRIENHYKYPQDIEWALKNNKFYILQTRPITTL